MQTEDQLDVNNLIKPKKPKKPKQDMKDWENLPTEKWNATTFTVFIDELNLIRFNRTPVYANKKILNVQITKMVKECGKPAVRTFVRKCVKEYKPTLQYPTIGFHTMRHFYYEKFMPAILAEIDMKEAREKEIAQQANDFSDVTDLF